VNVGIRFPASAHVGIVAGETSGDNLGAGLVRALGRLVPGVRFSGICGPAMEAAGCTSLFPMEQISLMGLDGLAGSVRRILSIRRKLRSHFVEAGIDLFVGIDVPDFNLSLESSLKRAGIPIVHYVSPTVWAWRGYRIRRIRRVVDHMLALFPFEEDFYNRHGVPVTFVGHPLADEIDNDDRAGARRELGLPETVPVVAILPGSRRSEIERLGPPFLGAARRIVAQRPAVRFVVPFASEAVRQRFTALRRETDGALPMLELDGGGRRAMEAADVVLLASGTAALESALLGRPMVVAYRVSPMTYALVRLFSHVRYYSMPNNLLPEPVVPELMQNRATPEALAGAVLEFLDDEQRRTDLAQQFRDLRRQLRGDASSRAAAVVAGMLAERLRGPVRR
jgi:lipid-A-disaccharide synthase